MNDFFTMGSDPIVLMTTVSISSDPFSPHCIMIEWVLGPRNPNYDASYKQANELF